MSPSPSSRSGLPVDVEALDDRVHRAHRRRPDAGHRQAALVAVLDLLRQLDDRRVHHVPDLAVDVVGERADADPDLRRGQPRAAGVVDGLDQVAHQGRQPAVEGLDLVSGRAEHRVTELADGSDRHAQQSLKRRFGARPAPSRRGARPRGGTPGEVPGLAAEQRRHLPGVVGDEPPRDDHAVGADELDRVVGQEVPGQPGDAGGQQRGVPLEDRADRALVEQQPAAGAAGVAQPELPGAGTTAGRANSVPTRSPASAAAAWAVEVTTTGTPACEAMSAASTLVAMPPVPTPLRLAVPRATAARSAGPVTVSTSRAGPTRGSPS